MTKAIGKVALIACGLLALQPVLGKIPLLGWFLTVWPVTWGLWIYLASMVIREARPYLQSSDNPRVPCMAYSALVGAVSGLAGAAAGVILNGVLAVVATAVEPAGSMAAAGYSLSASLSMISLITRPFWGMLVCGAAGLFMGGAPTARPLE